VAAPTPPATAPAAQESTKQAPPVQAPTQPPQEIMAKGDRLKASPLAKKLAGEQGIDLSVCLKKFFPLTLYF